MIDKIQNVNSLSLGGLDSLSSTDKTSNATFTGFTQGIENPGMNFASVLGSMATNTMNQLKGAEQMSFKAIEGKANTREVVDAVMEAQQSLQTAIALRDKIVSAYLEISKMPI